MPTPIEAAVLRDLGFRGYDTVYLVQPVPESVSARLADAAGAVLRQERIGSRARDEILVERLQGDAADIELIAAARRGRVPFRVAIAGDRVAVHLPHELADGVEGTRLVAALLRSAAGERSLGVDPALRMPLVRAVAAGRGPALRAYLAGRAERRALPDPAEPRVRTSGAFARITLDAAGLVALRRTRSSGGRATSMSRAASVALDALVSVADGSTDARVVFPADLRWLVGGRRVAGNFVSAEAYGTLRGTDWSPASINRMLAARRATGAVALGAAVVRGVVRPARAGAGPVGRPTISVSLMGAVDLPRLERGADPALSCATVGAAAGTFVFVAQVGEALTLSVWDDTGAFDVAAFPTAFREEIRRRTT